MRALAAGAWTNFCVRAMLVIDNGKAYCRTRQRMGVLRARAELRREAQPRSTAATAGAGVRASVGRA